MKKIPIKQKLILTIFGLFLCVALLELGLRIGGFVFLSLQERKNRIALQRKGAYCVMCLGESTTALGGTDSYPSQLEEILNQRDIGIRFSVINKGKPGIDTEGILSELEDNLNQYAPDMVIAMMGINDVREILVYEDILTKKTTSLFKTFRTYKLAKLIWLNVVNKAREKRITRPEEHIRFKTDDITSLFIYNDQAKLPKESIEITSVNYQECIRLAERSLIERKYDKSEEMYRKAIELRPESDEAYTGLGWCYWNQEDYDKFEEMNKKAIEINPECVKAYVALGWHRYSFYREYDEAEEMLNKAIEIDPEYYQGYISLGWCYWSQKKYDEFEETFKKAIEINPENDAAYGALAHFYQKSGKYRLADEYFRKANKIRLKYYNSITRSNYQRLKEIVTKGGIKLVCVQYPMRNVESLRRMLDDTEGIIIVDNEKVFKEAIKKAEYDEYFTDMFGGELGHFTPKGSELLAENIANVILKKCFKKVGVRK